MSVVLKRFTSVLIAVCATGAVAMAQPAPEGGPPGPPQSFDRAGGRQSLDARRAEHARDLHEVLGIQPDQERAFADFLAAMHPPRGPDSGPRDEEHGASMQAMTTPQRLDAMQAGMNARMARMRERFERRSAATKSLYAVLDARQQRIMDALPQLAGAGEH